MRIATPKEILAESVVKSGKRYWSASSQAVIVEPGTLTLDMPLVVDGKCQYLEWRSDLTGAQLEILGIEVVRIVDASLDQASGLSDEQKIAQAALGGWRCLVLRNFQSAYIESTSFGEATDLNNVHIGPGKRLHVRDCRFSNKSHYDGATNPTRWIGGGPIIDGVDEVLWDSCEGPHDVDMRLPDVARCKVFVAVSSNFASRTQTPNVLTDVERFSAVGCAWLRNPLGGGFVARGKRPIVDVLVGNAISTYVLAVDDAAAGYPAILTGPGSGGMPALPAWMRRRVDAAM